MSEDTLEEALEEIYEEFDIEPSETAERIGRRMAHLRD